MKMMSFPTETALADAATSMLTGQLQAALSDRGRASLMLSGGSSPKPIYERLANEALAWDGVGISLVDERWVASGAPGSNADFIQDCFADKLAARAHFIPLYNGHKTAADGVQGAEQALAGLAQPFDICVMGMGMDGHTASWFPRSVGLEDALDPDNIAILCAVDARGCEVAGVHTDRITLTYSAVAASRQVILLLSSAEKLRVFRQSLDLDMRDAPVSSLAGLGDRLTVLAVEDS